MNATEVGLVSSSSIISAEKDAYVMPDYPRVLLL